ncbi:MAG: 1-phosphofructokinase [Oscillospiraceae bacterium]|nr:1-phosphofructokinase [Oscillospiraceae bacterium]
MIYTVTVNPSLDYVMNIGELETGLVNRSSAERVYVGGKGINVSYVLKEFGVESTVLGFCAGFTGDYIKKELERAGISECLTQLPDGISRINVKLKGSKETEINGSGPKVQQEYIDKLYSHCAGMRSGDVMVLAGNVPSHVSPEIYHDMLDMVYDKNVLSVVDASGKLLTDTLDRHPFLIKPNIYELQDLFNVKCDSLYEISSYAGRLVEMGARNVIVSMDENGAMLVNETGSVYCEARKGQAVNSTGAGDSLVAGFIYKYLECGDIEKAFRFAVAVGTAAAFSEGLPVREDLMKIEI